MTKQWIDDSLNAIVDENEEENLKSRFLDTDVYELKTFTG